VFSVKLVKREAPPQLLVVLGAAGGFAAISAIFGSPIVAAILVIEAAGLGGATLPLIVLPGLMAAGIGSLVFIGMGDWTGLSTSAYSIAPLHLSAFSHPTWGQIGWTIVIGLAAAVATIPVRRFGLLTAGLVPKQPFVIIPLVGLVVAAIAIGFDQITDKGVDEVLFSGQSALSGFVASAGAWSLGTLALLFLCKAVAWSLCLGAFRGGPTFPAMFLGTVGGVAASHLPGMPETLGIAVGMAAMITAMLKLPLASIIIAASLTFTGGTALIPLVIVGVVVSYLATLTLEARLPPARPTAAPAVPAAPDATGSG
jgi:H+/Cl- antiporter ClcA